eukprot:435791_1
MFISLLLLVLNFNSIKSAALSNELSIVPGTVPPKELPFMIYNRYNNRCVRKLKYGFTKVGIEHIPMDADREECDDDDVRQLWKVKDVDESRRYFKLQNKNLWCLYADSNYNLKLVGCADAKLEAYGNGINAALWKFDAVGANENGDIEFRLKNKLNDCMDMNEGHSWMRSKDCKDNDKDQYFLMKLNDIDFNGATGHVTFDKNGDRIDGLYAFANILQDGTINNFGYFYEDMNGDIIINDIDFNGATGHVTFDKNGDRIDGLYAFANILQDGTINNFGYFYEDMNGEIISNINKDKIVFPYYFTENGLTPQSF